MAQDRAMVPVIVISGFLGSGKTTLLQKWVDRWLAAGLKPAVVMNELGEVNLDGEIIGGGVPMSELLGGCICCTISGDFGVELARMTEEEQPDVLLVETTGAANPMELIDGITEASLYVKLALVQVVVVVDSQHLLELHDKGKGKTYRLMEEQIRCADVLLINKTDLLTAEQRVRVEQIAREWNAKARLIHTVKCEVNGSLPELWSGAGIAYGDGRTSGLEQDRGQEVRGERDEHERGAARSEQEPHHCGPDCTHAHHHGIADSDRNSNADSDLAHHSHDHVMVYTHYFEQPVDSEQFEQFIAGLPQQVYRAKGILRFTDTASRYLFQYAYRQTDYMAITPQKEVPDVLVLIGEHMPTETLKAALDRLAR